MQPDYHPILPRFRSRFGNVLQLLALAGMVFQPLALQSTWVDTDSDSTWDAWQDPSTSATTSLVDLDAQSSDIDGDNATNEEERNYGSDPFVFDSDGDGLSDGDEIHLAIEGQGKGYSLTSWDSNGDYISDFDDFHIGTASAVPGFPGVVYTDGVLPEYSNASYSDYDGDGIKNPFDLYPADPLNNDADQDGIDDGIDPVLDDAANPSPVNGQSWGGAALSDDDNDAISNFYDDWPDDSSNGSGDVDGDGIPNGTDPSPRDHDNTSPANSMPWGLSWDGDDDEDGIINFHDANPYTPDHDQTLADADEDEIPDIYDLAPDDSTNTSSINGVAWYRTGRADYDGDGVRNFFDPYPYDYYNGVADVDGDGLLNNQDPIPAHPDNVSWVNNQAWYGNVWNDDDNDGIFNFWDAWPQDPYNNSPDYDMDGVLNADDPAPYDAGNYSDHNHVAWGGRLFDDDDYDGVQNYWDGSPSPEPPPEGSGSGGGSGGDPPPTPNDADGDGIDDSIDPNSADYSNFSPYNLQGWASYADVFGDADGDLTQNFWDSSPYPDTSGTQDSDYDGIADVSDPYPWDASNYSLLNDTAWHGSALNDDDNDGLANYCDLHPYQDSNADADGDGIVDVSDPAPNDSGNFSYQNGLTWNGLLFNDDDGDGIQNFWDTSPYPPPPPPDNDGDGLNLDQEIAHGTSDENVDTDGDGLTDYEEVQVFGTSPTNRHHLSQQAGWGDIYTDWQLVDLTDSDSDGIPDRVEQHYSSYGLSETDPMDALRDIDLNGLNNRAQYQMGVALDYDMDRYDADGDGITDVYEDYHGLNKQNPADAVGDADEDGVTNYEEMVLLLDPGNPDTPGGGGALGDLLHLILSVRYPNGGEPADEDLDGNGVSDWVDALLAAGPSAPDHYRFVRVMSGDLDGDGLPDDWEHRYGRWRFSNGLQMRVADAQEDNDDDGISNDWEFLLGTSPIAGDSDSNGVLDMDEDHDGDGLSNAQEFGLGTSPAKSDTDGDGVSDLVEIQEGTDPLDASSSSIQAVGLRVFTPWSSGR